MKRKLLKQVGTEWRSNLWLALELLIISVVICWILDCTAYYARIGSESIGFDYNNVYQINYNYLTHSSPGYVEHTDESENSYTDFMALERRLREAPEVEATGRGSTSPYNYNFWGMMATIKMTGVDTVIRGRTLNRYEVRPEYMKVFRTHGIKGETPEQLMQVLEEGKVIVTANTDTYLKDCKDPMDLYNARIYFSDDDSVGALIGAVIPAVKRTDYEKAFHGTLIKTGGPRGLYVRVKDGMGDKFMNRLATESQSFNYGNAYLIGAKPFSKVRSDLHHSDWAKLRNLFICAGFLLLTVFLGLLGTFWFRTQQRIGEIAIRKVNGATRAQIFRRLIGEGLLLLLIVTPIAYDIDLLLARADLSTYLRVFGNEFYVATLIFALLSALMIALMIIAGIYFPARKAMKIEPADVLRGE